MTATLYIGDVHDRLAQIPDNSVDLVVTSPPFLALRSYLPADHPDKAKEIGSEPTPAAFIDTLLALTAEWRRVLTPYGSICVELGDTYAGSGGAGGDYADNGWHEGQEKFKQQRGPGWPLDKCLTGIPSLYCNSLAYGYNLLNPDHRIDRWRIRNYLTWCRPNPPVGALGDKFRPATSFVTVATMGRDRWFDLDAVRTIYKGNQSGNALTFASNRRGDEKGRRGAGVADTDYTQGAGAPPLDWDAPDDWDQHFAAALDDFLAGWWQPLVDLPTQPYGGAHYATFPMELARRLIEAMCPRSVCLTCGEPRRRITKATEGYAEFTGESWADRSEARSKANGRERNSHSGQPKGAHIQAAEYTTLGWTDCGHDTWRNGIVLDPFAGSGTTLAAATGCGRDAIGIDLDDRNVDLCRERVGMFLEVAA